MDLVVLLIGSLILAYWMIRNMCPWLIRNTRCECEFKEVKDPRPFWDLMKYKIRQESIFYSKMKAKERRSKMATLDSRLNNCQKMCDQDPSPENMNTFEVIRTEYELQNDYITQGAIIQTQATGYEQVEKSSKYFLNLENSRGKKSSKMTNPLLQTLKQL